MYDFDTADQDGPGADVETVFMTKGIHEPAGRFTLTFAPRQPVKGYFWSDLIPSLWLVEIFTQRYPTDQAPGQKLPLLGMLADGGERLLPSPRAKRR